MTLLQTILETDHALFHTINQSWTSPFCDRLMPFIAAPGHFTPFMGLGAILLLVWGGFRGRLFIAIMALALLIGDAGINHAIKHLVHRPRPYQSMEGVRMVKQEGITFSGIPTTHPTGESFTSGHACNNVALAFMACAVFGRAAWFLWVWAFLISYSRVYTGDHYPLDILGAWILSPLYCLMIVAVSARLWNYPGSKWFSSLHAKHPKPFESYPC